MPTLFLKVHSSGLYKRKLEPNDPSQPWICEIAADLRDDSGKRIRGGFICIRIRAQVQIGAITQERSVELKAEAIHGISTKMARSGGVDETPALGSLIGLWSMANVLVGHGIDFDWDIVNSLIARKNAPKAAQAWRNRPLTRRVCTMKAAMIPCNIPHPDEADTLKYPTLDEAAFHLCQIPPWEGFRDAWEDCQRSAAVYYRLLQMGLLQSDSSPSEPLPEDPAFGYQAASEYGI